MEDWIDIKKGTIEYGHIMNAYLHSIEKISHRIDKLKTDEKRHAALKEILTKSRCGLPLNDEESIIFGEHSVFLVIGYKYLMSILFFEEDKKPRAFILNQSSGHCFWISEYDSRIMKLNDYYKSKLLDHIEHTINKQRNSKG